MKRQSVISTSIFSALVFILMIFFFHPQVSYAHAPQDVKIEYDSGSQTLAVTITHNSPFPSFHHIKTVEIKKNSAVINTVKYDTQPDKSPFIYTYKVEAVQGDKLEVTATCNLSGSKTATITVSPSANAGK
jgi:desulfoferrodoxin (superoxide reductase-like protein)